MINCPNCHKALEDDARFCDACGTRLELGSRCPVCGASLEAGDRFCPVCGEATLQTAEPVPGSQPRYQAADAPKAGKAPKEKAPKAPMNKKTLTIIIAAVVAVVIIAGAVVAALTLFGGGKDEAFAAYVKDGELFYSDFGKDGAIEISNGFYDEEPDDYSNLDGLFMGFHIQKAGDRLFYADKWDEYEESYTLYYRDMNKKKAEPVKVDSDVHFFDVNDDGTALIYAKSEDNVLYYSDLEDKTKIESDIGGARVCSEFEHVVYLNEDMDIVSYDIKTGEREKLARGVDEVEAWRDNNTVFYLKDEALYVVSPGTERVKIAEDVENVVQTYETGEVYYTVAEEIELPMMTYFDDDLAESDKNLPATDSDRQLRDVYREYLNEETFSHTERELYYYNGSESILVCEDMNGIFAEDEASDAPVLVVETFANPEKVATMSELFEDSEAAFEKLYDATDDNFARHIVVGSSISKIDLTDVGRFAVMDDGSGVYVIADVEEFEKEDPAPAEEGSHVYESELKEGEGTLYYYSIEKGVVGEPVEIDDDVDTRSIRAWNNFGIAYFKNINKDGDHGDLYINGEEISYDVYTGDIIYDEDMDTMVFFTDWDEDDEAGNGFLYENGKCIEIGDDIHDVMFVDGVIYIMDDYSSKHDTFCLDIWGKKGLENVDEDVNYLIYWLDGGIPFGWAVR